MRNPLPFLLLAPAASLLAQEPPAEPPPAIVVEDGAEDPDSEYYVAPEPAAKPARRSELADPKRVRETATLVCGLLGEAHVLRKPFDERMSPAAWTNYIDSFDPQRIYFTAEDIDSFEPARTRYASLLRAGDLSFPSNVFARFVERVADRNAFAAKAAAEEFDFDVDEDYLWRRKGEPWPHEGAEQDDLWRKRVKNTLLAARVSFVIDREGKAEEAARRAEKGEPEKKDEKKEKTEEEAVASAREDMLKSAERFLQILRDSDEEFWLPRFYDCAALAYDPHSNYMSPASSEDFDIDMNLSLQGIGATLQTDDGACKIVEIVPGSPAERDESPEHLVRGDKIIAVAQGEDGEFVDIRHWPLYKSVRLIRGPKGSTVRLRVIPVSDPDTTKVVTLVRDEIKLEEQAAAGRVETFLDDTAPAPAPTTPRAAPRRTSRASSRSSTRRAPRGWCSTCAATAADRSPRRSASPGSSSAPGRSSSSARAAGGRWRCRTTTPPSRSASRSSSSSTASAPPPPRSSPPRCRTTAAPSSRATSARTARARSRP